MVSHVACVVLLCQVGKRRLVRPFGQVWVDFFEVPPTATMFDYFLLLVTLQCITGRCVEVCLRCCATAHRKVMMIGRQVSGESFYGCGVWPRYGVSVSRSCVPFITGPARHEFDTRPTYCAQTNKVLDMLHDIASLKCRDEPLPASVRAPFGQWLSSVATVARLRR